MSMKVMAHIWEHADVSGSELLVLLAMADFADDDGRNIYPSMPTLAKKARLSESQTRRVVQDLCEAKVIELVLAGGWEAGRNRSNQYRICAVHQVAGGGVKLLPPVNVTPPSKMTGGSVDATTVVAPALPDPSSDPLEDTNEEDDEEDEILAAVYAAWQEQMPQELTSTLEKTIGNLIDDFGPEAVIHGIVASVAHGSPHIGYVSACARNHGKETTSRAGHRRHPRRGAPGGPSDKHKRSYNPDDFKDTTPRKRYSVDEARPGGSR